LTTIAIAGTNHDFMDQRYGGEEMVTHSLTICQFLVKLKKRFNVVRVKKDEHGAFSISCITMRIRYLYWLIIEWWRGFIEKA